MVRLEKDKIIIEVETTAPAEELVAIKEAIQFMIIQVLETGDISQHPINAAYFLTNLELSPDQAKKLIEK